MSVQYYNPTGLNGDMKRGGQISIASATATGINNDAHVLVPRENNVTKYYPAISNDDALVVYNQSTCGVDPDVYTNLTTGVGVYGAQTCDGYDDSSATLWLTTPTGSRAATPRQRQRRSHALRQLVAALEPGQRHVPRPEAVLAGLLVAAAVRPAGEQRRGRLTTKPQLWFSAVLDRRRDRSLDPSSPPVWLPNQNPTPVGRLPNQTPTGNHVPQWVKVAVPIPG